MSFSPSSVLLLSVGIFLGSFPSDALAAGIGTTSSKMNIPRIRLNRSSNGNGGSVSYSGAEYATHRPYKVDFDLLKASDRSHELEMPLLRNNGVLDDSTDPDYFLASDPTLRSRRRRKRQVESQQVISATSSDFQRFNLCLPYINTNPMCRQIFFGLTNNNPATVHSNLVQNHAHGHVHHPSALAVPSSASPSTTTFYVPAAFPPSSSVSSLSSSSSPVVASGPLSRNDLAILNYYQQQQFPPQQQQQAQFQQLGVFQGPIPVQRQRPQYDNIHTKYPYPYPPTDIGQQPVQIVPESGSTAAEGLDGGATTDVPSDGAQTTLLPDVPGVEQQQGADPQNPAAPATPGNFPDSPVIQQQPEESYSQGNAEVIQTTYNPAAMMSSSPLPPSSSQTVDLSTPSPSQGQQPPGAPQGGSVPVSPDQQDGPGSFQQPPQPPQPPLPIQVQQSIPQQPPQVDLALQERLREQEDEIRRLQSQIEQSNLQAEEEIRRIKSQLEQANLQVVSYEQENGMMKDQFMRSEEANIKLRDRVLQLENTNQHLQEQNGQLQQVTAEQRQQINGLKASVKESKDQLDNYQNQVNPLSEEVQKHRKEIEDFLIRIRKLGEENETCKKQVRLYQLKVNYIMDQQRQQQQQQEQRQQQKKKQPSPSSKQPTAADLTVHDDELDPELSRMDAEIAALQKNADEVAAAIQNLPESLVPQPAEHSSSPANVVVPVSALPPAASSAAVVKKENEFPGEAVQVDPQQAKHKQQEKAGQKIATAADVARAESASRTIPPANLPAWEQPAGF